MSFLSKNQLGSIYAIISCLCYGVMGYFGINIIDSGLSTYNMLFWRFLITTLIMFFICIPQINLISSQYKNCFRIILYGICFFSVSAITYFLASTRIGTGFSIVIFFIYPAIVIIMNIILYKAKITKSYYIAFALNIIGLLFMLNNKEFSFDIFGIIFAILSAISYAFYILASKKMEVSPLLSTLMVSIGCTITCFISALIHSSLKIPNELYVWMNLFGIAIICTAIPTLFLLKALKYISSERVSLLSVFQTLFVFILGVMLLGEQVNNLQIIGIVILLSGTLLISFFERTSH